jgi:hypothetical protein
MPRKAFSWLIPLGILILAALNGEGPWPPM